MAAKRVDTPVVIAIAWFITALALTLLFADKLGLRGWFWLGIHHVLCVAGVTHELRRGWKRHKARVQATNA